MSERTITEEAEKSKWQTREIDPALIASQEAEMDSIISERYRYAVTAYAIEQTLVSGRSDKEITETVNASIKTLPPEIAERYERAVMLYLDRKHKADACRTQMEQWVVAQQNAGTLDDEPSYAFGAHLFSLLTRDGLRPTGKVKFEIREGYLILICNHEDDFALLNEDAYASTIAGSYAAQVFIPAFTNSYHGPVLYVGPSEDGVEQTILHERQHFINDVIFEDFEIIEPKVGPGIEDNSKRLRKIKNEVIAYLREGYRGSEVAHEIRSAQYRDLFRNISEPEQQHVDMALEALEEFTGVCPEAVDKSEHAAILTYELASIPLSKFPRWLPRLAEYFKTHLAMEAL